MDRKLATIQVIENLQPIDGADKIEVASILGWKCVVKKNEFSIGDKCVYCEVDSVLPPTAEFDFLKSKKYRIKTIRLRGQISQGLALPLTSVWTSGVSYEIGQDVTERIGITLWQPVIPAVLKGKIKSTFPSFITKTDQERLQNHPSILKKYPDTPFRVTEKLDGTSFTAYVRDGEFGFCSRRMELDIEDKYSTYYRMVEKYDLESRMLNYYNLSLRNIAIQGEIIGQGIQGNKYRLKDNELFLFDIFDIDKSSYVDREEFLELANKFKVSTAPSVFDIKSPNSRNMEEMIELTNIKSKIYEHQAVEGLVWTSIKEYMDPKLGRLTFKVINPEFLLKCEE